MRKKVKVKRISNSKWCECSAKAVFGRCSSNRCQAWNFIKKGLQHRCFPTKFTKSLRTLFFKEHLYSDGCFSTLMAASLLWWLLLTVNSVNQWRHTLKVYPEVFQTLFPILATLHEKVRSSRPELFCKKGVFENFANQRCFPVNFRKFSRTPFFIVHLRWLLLKN